MKSKSFVVTILTSLAISFFATLAFVPTNSESYSLNKTKANLANNPDDYAHIDDSLPLTDSGSLFISTTNATKTELGESFTFRFSANTVLYPIATTGTRLYPQTTGIYVTPNDDSYPADKTLKDLTKYDVDLFTVTADDELVSKDAEGNPEIDEVTGYYKLVDGHAYSYQIPTYNAFVSRIDTRNTDRNGINTLVIPYSITFGSWFKLSITEFGENVVYNVNNATLYDGVKTIIIGDNIEKIPENALQEAPEDLVIKTTYESLPGEWNPNFTTANVVYGYTPEAKELEIFDTTPQVDQNGNIKYFDEYGSALNEENKYIDENGEVIKIQDEDGEWVEKVYEGTALTRPNAYEFKAGNYQAQASEMTFILGNVNESKNINLPLLIKYDVVKGETRDTRVYECPVDDISNGYDAIGSDAGKYSVSKNVDIRLNEGESIDESSLELYNIFEGSLVSEGASYTLVPDETLAYRSKPSITFAKKNSIDDFFKFSFDSVKTVFGYTSLSLKVDLVPGIYQEVKTATYKNFEDRILEGKYKIRYAFRDFKNTDYYFEDVDGQSVYCKMEDSITGEIPQDLDYKLFKQEKSNSLTFFFNNRKLGKEINPNKLAKVELCGFRITLDLCSTSKGTTQIVTKSSISFRFGYMDLLPKEASSISKFNGDAFLIFYSIAFILLYFGASLGYYLYAKAKYKNDEFRRINGKAYIKKMSKAFIGAFLIAGSIAFIFLRFMMVNPSIIAFNPLDPFVIAFGVSGLIAFGYFIKYLVLYVRQEKERRKIMKLKLDEDVDNDGVN